MSSLVGDRGDLHLPAPVEDSREARSRQWSDLAAGRRRASLSDITSHADRL
jgi:hypothetical protein